MTSAQKRRAKLKVVSSNRGKKLLIKEKPADPKTIRKGGLFSEFCPPKLNINTAIEPATFFCIDDILSRLTEAKSDGSIVDIALKINVPYSRLLSLLDEINDENSHLLYQLKLIFGLSSLNKIEEKSS